MGPGPPRKKADKNCSQAALNPLGPESRVNSYAMSTGTGSTPTAVEGSRTSGEGWNRTRYQREDEALWGHDTPGPGQRIFDAIARAGSTAGRLLEGRLTKSEVEGSSDDENPKSYYLAKNPPVNDLHPPVVSTQPASRDETRWMLQPPPPAKVMEGKERVMTRTRTVSAGSSRKGLEGSPLSRPATGRLDEVRELPIEAGRPRLWEEPGSKAPTPSDLNGQPHERSSEESVVHTRQNPPRISTPRSGGPGGGTKYLPSSVTSVQDAQERPEAKKENEGPTALRELSTLSSNNAMNSRSTTSSNRLSSGANSMPITLPSMESKFPGTPTPAFPKPAAAQSTGRASLGIDLDATNGP